MKTNGRRILESVGKYFDLTVIPLYSGTVSGSQSSLDQIINGYFFAFGCVRHGAFEFCLAISSRLSAGAALLLQNWKD